LCVKSEIILENRFTAINQTKLFLIARQVTSLTSLFH
jgi:hypothetical protein